MNRRGSALLIVLGVLSFLVVSAVAFSAFMRRSRLPSSYLRHSVASRQLAKAALASAIDEIDHAIANDVHPGIGGKAENTWRDRVFFKRGDEQSITDTAPTLTFEGLAYIPPPLVNEARYWSRKTPTANWTKIPYDVGRYAYCALDVSDYFDVNRLMSTCPRSSAANRRITISHLFEPSGENPHNAAPSDAKKWDDFMKKFRKVDAKTLEIDYESSSTIPLVSMADFNLALAAEKGIGNIKSAFGEYVEKNQSQFFPGKGSKELRPYAEMTFVTDGWFPKARNANTDASGNTQTTERYDIGDGKYQPYQMDMLGDDPVSLSEAVVFYKDIAPSAEAKIWNERLSGYGMAALADYLDKDHYPISLAVPTTEQVPMICGIEVKLSQPPVFSVECKGDKEEDMTGVGGSKLDTSEQATTREVQQEVTWTINGYELAKGFQGGKVHTLVTYPFLHRVTQTPSWELDGIFSLFLTADSPMQFRTDNPGDMLSIKNKNMPGTGMSDDRKGVLTVNLGTAVPNFPKEYSKEEEAVWEGDLDMRGGMDLSAKLNDNPLLKVTYVWTQTRQMKDGKMTEWSPKFEDVQSDPSQCNDLKASTVLPALDMSGNVSSKFKEDALSQMIKKGEKVHVYLNAAVWLRIKEGNEVVDMVPAHVSDDKVQMDVDDSIFSGGGAGSLNVFGHSGPVMKFNTKSPTESISFDFGVEGLKGLKSSTETININPKALMVSDPRHNHMPENWFADSAGSITPEKWLDSLDDLDGTRDGDIFMATSDAGYLQSIYELAFLPRFKPLAGTTQSRAGNYNIPTGNNWHDGVYADKAGGTLNAEFMWRTYDPIGEDRDAFNEFPFTSEGTGMKVNPYSNSTNVLMAAFANTPVSWRYAHTNYEFNTELKNYQKDVAEFNKNYAWNGYSNYKDSKFMWEDLEKVAGIFMDCVKTAGNSGWTTAWNNFKWYDLCADGKLYSAPEIAKHSDTANLWDADRKFLYGFWRDCFAARQQLFLIFVRAEPLLLGGGSADQLPPQLGARAVALVWRDPTPVSGTDVKDGYPHRTRILFYKPLD